MPQPNLLLLDEPSAGVAPIFVDLLFAKIAEVSRAGVTVLMVEQNAPSGARKACKRLAALPLTARRSTTPREQRRPAPALCAARNAPKRRDYTGRRLRPTLTTAGNPRGKFSAPATT